MSKDIIDIDDLKYKAAGEMSKLTDKLYRVAVDDLHLDISRDLIYDYIEEAVEKLHVDKFVKKLGRKFSIWFKNTFRGRKRHK